MPRALVLSGGGAKGAFQVGALKCLRDNHPGHFHFDLVAGVSVGSLNGALIAQDQLEELITLWNTLDNRGVYTGNINLLRAVFRVIFRNKGILGIEPLAKKIQENCSLNTVKTDFRMGFVSVTSGAYVTCKHTDFADDENFRKALVASCSMPVIWPPVGSVVAAGKRYENLVDGGVRNVSPLGDVIDANPTEVIVINCQSEVITPDPTAATSLVTIAKRALTELTIDEIFRSDIDEFVKINRIVNQCAAAGHTVYKDPPANTKPYVAYKSIIIEPPGDLGDTLDFSQRAIQRRMQAGYEAANDVFGRLHAGDNLVARSFAKGIVKAG